MKNIPPLKLWYLISVHFIKRKNKFFLISTALIFLIVFAFFKLDLFRQRNLLSEGLVGTYQTHDLPLDVTEVLSDGLVKFSDDGKVIPNLVIGWETNSDATIFKFKLKDNLKWIDGQDIKSTDLDFGIPNVAVSYPDEKTIEFKLKESYSPFPSLLTKPIFRKGTLIGTGPYQIKKVEKSKIFITKIVLLSSTQTLPEINIRFYPNEKTALTGFNLGEVAVLLGINNRSVLENPQVKQFNKTNYQEIVTILFNTDDKLLGNRSTRQALSYISPIIEKQEIANNPFSNKSWAYDPTAKKYLNNKEEAEEAVQRAKSSAGEGLLKKELVLTTTPYLEEVGKKVVATWKSLGFDAKLRVESGIPQNFQALLITQTIPEDPDQYFLWHSTQKATNLSNYSSARVDKDLEDGRKTSDEEVRKDRYFDFQKALLEDTPAVFLYYPKVNVFYLRKVEENLMKVLPLQIN